MTKPIIALDFPNASSGTEFLSQFENESLYVKVGMELYYQAGASLLSYLLHYTLIWKN